MPLPSFLEPQRLHQRSHSRQLHRPGDVASPQPPPQPPRGSKDRPAGRADAVYADRGHVAAIQGSSPPGEPSLLGRFLARRKSTRRSPATSGPLNFASGPCKAMQATFDTTDVGAGTCNPYPHGAAASGACAPWPEHAGIAGSILGSQSPVLQRPDTAGPLNRSRKTGGTPTTKGNADRSVVRPLSLRGRFRLKGKATPRPDDQGDALPVKYVPKHAASDFSRMPVPPRYGRPGYESGPWSDETRQLSSEVGQTRVFENDLGTDLAPPGIASNPRPQTPRTLGSQQLPESQVRVLSRGLPNPPACAQVVAAPADEVTQRWDCPAEISELEPRSASKSSASPEDPSAVLDAPRQRLPGTASVEATSVCCDELSDYQVFLLHALEEDRLKRHNEQRSIGQQTSAGRHLDLFSTAPSAPAPLEDIRESSVSNTHPKFPLSDGPAPDVRNPPHGPVHRPARRSVETQMQRGCSHYARRRSTEPGPEAVNWLRSGHGTEKDKLPNFGGDAIPGEESAATCFDRGYARAPPAPHRQAGLRRQGSIAHRIAEYIKPSQERSSLA